MIQKQALAILGSPHSSGITATMLKHSVNVAEKRDMPLPKSIYMKKILPIVQDAGHV